MAEKLPVALQLYTVRDHTANDMAGTLRKVAKLGYTGVELAGYGNLTREQLKAVIDETGLRITSSHIALNKLQNDLEDVITEAKLFGHHYVIMPYLAVEQRNNWKELAATLNAIGKKLSEHGLQLCYHNHAFEFEEKIDGQYAFDVLYANSEAQFLQAEIDVYWVKKGGEDPADYIQKYSGRAPILHIKDIADDGSFAEVGAGNLDWDDIFNAAKSNGVKHYIVEQDICPGDSLDSARISIENLRQMGVLG